MNKRLIVFGAAATIAAILLLWGVPRLSWIGQSPNLVGIFTGMILCVLGFPLKLYSLVTGQDQNFSILLLVFFLLVSGLIWGVVLERAVTFLSRKNRLAEHR